MKKLLLFTLVLLSLCSCNSHKFKVKIRYNDSTIDTIITNDDNLRINRFGELKEICGCRVYARGVDDFRVLKEIQPTPTDIKISKEQTKVALSIISLIALIVIAIIVVIKVSKTNSIMKKVFAIMCYLFLLILAWKVGIVLLHYLPSVIENLFK